MNERIRELAEQAGFYVLSDDKIYIPTTSEEITDCQTKFAELLIKECANIARQTETDDSDDYKSGRTWASLDILEHFGV